MTLSSKDMTPAEWDIIDSIIDEATKTRGNRYTQREAVRILIIDRRERGIINRAEFDRINDYMFGWEK